MAAVKQAVGTVVLPGAVVGYVSGRMMDRATTWFLDRQSAHSKKREQELLPQGAPTSAARKLAGAVGRDLPAERGPQLGMVVHGALGLLYGMAATALTTRRVPPLVAGLLAGAAGFVLMDEGANSAFGITPPPAAYPAETHARGVVGHLTFGLVSGGMLAAAKRVGMLRRG